MTSAIPPTSATLGNWCRTSAPIRLAIAGSRDSRIANVARGSRAIASRTRLRAVAYRILGSASEADDAIQETWLKLSRSGSQEEVQNLGGWLTTVLARVCLDMLRDSVGPALLIVLDTLAPAERVAFVLHDMFNLPLSAWR